MILTVTILLNIFKRDDTETKGIVGYEVNVSVRIMSLKVTFKQRFALRAILVFEHRNLNFLSQVIKPHVEDLLIVQVSSCMTCLLAVLLISKDRPADILL